MTLQEGRTRHSIGLEWRDSTCSLIRESAMSLGDMIVEFSPNTRGSNASDSPLTSGAVDLLLDFQSLFVQHNIHLAAGASSDCPK